MRARAIPSLPRKAWWCEVCDVVTFCVLADDRLSEHAKVRGRSCVGQWRPVVLIDAGQAANPMKLAVMPDSPHVQDEIRRARRDGRR